MKRLDALAAEPWVIVANQREIASFIANLDEGRTIKHLHAKVIRGVTNGSSVNIGVVGMGGIRSRRGLAELLENYCFATATIVGVVGGLAPHLKPGETFLVPWLRQGGEGSLGSQRRVLASAAQTERIAQDLNLLCGGLLSMDRLLISAENKQAFFSCSQALGVDLETFGLVEILESKGVPTMVLRAVSDTAHEALPAALEAFVEDNSNIFRKLGAIVNAVRKKPGLSLWQLRQRLNLCSTSLEAILPRVLSAFLLDKRG